MSYTVELASSRKTSKTPAKKTASPVKKPASKSASKSVSKSTIVVFTDGSCSANGKESAIGGIGIHFPNEELKDLSKVYREGCPTSQRTELFAILTALRYIKQSLDIKKFTILVKTDSKYSIDCITKWVPGWIKNGWKTKAGTPVANKEFIEMIYKYYTTFDIKFEHVEGHSKGTDPDSVANNIADKLATSATGRRRTENIEKPIIKKKSPSLDFDVGFSVPKRGRGAEQFTVELVDDKKKR